MKNRLSDKRGHVLVYVLFAIALLALLTPPLLGIASSRSSSDKALTNKIAANQLASSAMESFFTYLNRSSGLTKSTWNHYLNAYTGWTPPSGIPITLPDGSKISFRQDLCTDKDCSTVVPLPLPAEVDTQLEDYYVRVCAVAGDTDGNLIADEQLSNKQEIIKPVPINRKGQAVIIDPSDPNSTPACVAPGQTGVIVGGTGGTGALLTMPVSMQVMDTTSQIGQVIGSFLDYQQQKAQTLLSEVTYKSESCEEWRGVAACTYTDIVNMYNNRKAQGIKPIYIKAKQLTGGINFNIGTVDNPLILVVEQVTASSLAGTFTGSLFVSGTLGTAASPTQLSLTLKKGKNETGVMDYGSLYVMGDAQQQGSSKITAEGNVFYGGSSTFTNGSVKISANTITVVGQFSVTSGAFDLTSTGGPASFGSLDVSKSPTDINAVSGDLFIEGDFTGSSNNVNVSVSGVVAVGGDLTVPSSNITADGQGTSLYLPGISGPEYCTTP